ncbi:MAG: tRNA threonylcarbamoyladenosine dehydratase [Candidatus Azobacteroides sp.]|nr:tRNA threonylcarbamoyladenosine dehydratase [Candidatus Azobacteroides sp.]
MEDWTTRTELLFGKERLDYLRSKHVLIAGVGGVGAYAAEMICRAGIGKITIVDGDIVQPSNINRQLVALTSTLKQPKVDILAKRLSDINPGLVLEAKYEYLQDEKIPQLLDREKYDFVVDAIDTLSPKVFLIYHTRNRNINLISSMGAGAKSDPSRILIDNLSNTYHCTLAKFVKKRLRKMGVSLEYPVVFSTELPDKEAVVLVEEKNKKSMVGTVSYMPAIFGCYLASHVIRHI